MPRKFDADDLATLEWVADALDLEVHHDYSGRAMFGRTCFGLSGRGSRAGAMFRLAVALHEEDRDDLVEAFAETDASEDSLGLGWIVYWPGLTVPPEVYG